jgi:hypothetical protein
MYGTFFLLKIIRTTSRVNLSGYVCCLLSQSDFSRHKRIPTNELKRLKKNKQFCAPCRAFRTCHVAFPARSRTEARPSCKKRIQYCRRKFGFAFHQDSHKSANFLDPKITCLFLFHLRSYHSLFQDFKGCPGPHIVSKCSINKVFDFFPLTL